MLRLSLPRKGAKRGKHTETQMLVAWNTTTSHPKDRCRLFGLHGAQEYWLRYLNGLKYCGK